MFSVRCEWQCVRLCDVVSERGYFMYYREVLEETDGCVCVDGSSEYVSFDLYGCRFRCRFKKFVCFMPLCIRFKLAVNRSGRIFL